MAGRTVGHLYRALLGLSDELVCDGDLDILGFLSASLGLDDDDDPLDDERAGDDALVPPAAESAEETASQRRWVPGGEGAGEALDPLPTRGLSGPPEGQCAPDLCRAVAVESEDESAPMEVDGE